VAILRTVNSEASISVLCHSYASVVCGYAAADPPILPSGEGLRCPVLITPGAAP
jgi:hypothetical protein